MKKVLALTLMTLGSFLWADAPMQNLPQVDPFELLNNMDPKELDKLMEDLAKMSPEEIKYYEDLGKQMFKQSGYDLDEIAKTFPAQAPAPAQPVTTKQPEPNKPSKQEKPKPAVDEPSKKEKDSLLRMIKALSDSLASIRQKAANDETLHPHLAPLQQELDLLTAYVNRFDYEKHLKHLGDKEFAALKTKLRKLSSMLEEFDNNLFVPELTLRKSADTKKSSYVSQMQEATSIVKEFKTYMTNAFSSDAIITDIESLFKKHDQEALTIKKQIEDQQKKAIEQVKKLSTTNTGRFAPIPKVTNQPAKSGGSGSPYNTSGGGSRTSGYPSGNQGNAGHGQKHAGSQQPQQPPKAGDQAKAKPSEKGKEGEDAKTREKKENDFAELPLSPQEALEKVKKDLRTVNIEVARHKQDLLRLADDINTTQKPSQADRDTLLPVVKSLKTAQKSLDDYITKVLSKEKDSTVATKHKKMLKDLFENQSPELIEINTKFTPLVFTGPFTADKQEAMEDARELVEDFKKFFNNITKQFKTTRNI